MTENTTESVLSLSLVTEQECQRRVEQARAKEQKRIEHTIQFRINAMPVPPDDNRPSVLRAIRVELQRVLADIREPGEEADDAHD